MLIIPAIDLKEGKCVRLEQGLMDKATVYSEDPGTTARHWEAQGAELLHVVDLNGAFAGVPKNLDAIKAIRAAIKIPIEVGGGIRDMATIETLVSIGIDRIILGTAAIENPAFVQEACRKFPGRIIVGIDAKEGLVAIKGWAEVTKVQAVDLAQQMQEYGVIAIIYTDIKRDGMLSGPEHRGDTGARRSAPHPGHRLGRRAYHEGHREPADRAPFRRLRGDHRQGDLQRIAGSEGSDHVRQDERQPLRTVEHQSKSTA